MATGVTKNNWSEATHIIPSEQFSTESTFELKYKGKESETKIIKTLNKKKYTSLYGATAKNKLFYGDNLDVLRFLIHSWNMKGKISLVYIDPPYGTNSIFQSRNQKDSYKDDLVGSHYIEFLRKRLVLLRELLSDDGSIYIHLDSNMMAQIKIVMDEIFEPKNFRGLISRKKCSNKNSTKNTFGNISDYILFYSKTNKFKWHRAVSQWPENKIQKEYPCIDEITGRRYKKVPIHAPGIRNGETGKEWRGMLPPHGKHWQYTPEKLDELDRKGDIYWSQNGNPRRKVYFETDKGIPVQDIWMDVQDSLNQNIKITGYPTEKNPDLLQRIIQASSSEDDIVLDCFAGSGTTLDVARKLHRTWIGVDSSSEAIDNILKRFFIGLTNMGDYVQKNDNHEKQIKLFEHFDSPQSNPEFELISDSQYNNIINELLSSYLDQ